MPESSRTAPDRPCRRSWRAALCLALGLAALAPALGRPAASAPADSQHTLWIGKNADPQTLDPAITVDNNDWAVTYPCYHRLTRYKVVNGRGSTEVEGDLAERWRVSLDNLVWEFQLRPGQAFDDGVPVDASAVKFSFDRLKKLDQGPSELLPEGLKVTVVDAMTVRFTLARVCPYFLNVLAANCTGIINPNVMSQRDPGPDARFYLASHTAGSGPFRLVSWEKSQSLVLEPNPGYGGKTPVLRRVVVKIIHDPLGMRLLLENGDLDLVEGLPQEELAVVERKPRLTVYSAPSFQVTYLYLNNQRPPLKDPQLRRAISWAVDYRGIIKDIMKGQAIQMRGVIPEGMWGHDPGVLQYGTDLKRAKELLGPARSGPVHLGFLYSDRQPEWEPIAQSVQASLGQLGLDVRLEKMANATMRDRIDKGDYDISIGTWSPDFADPFTYMNFWFDSARTGLRGNRSFYANAQVDDLIRSAGTQADPPARLAKYQQAQRTVVEEAAYVYLFQAKYRVALRRVVKGFIFNPMLEYIYNLDTIHKDSGQ